MPVNLEVAGSVTEYCLHNVVWRLLIVERRSCPLSLNELSHLANGAMKLNTVSEVGEMLRSSPDTTGSSKVKKLDTDSLNLVLAILLVATSLAEDVCLCCGQSGETWVEYLDPTAIVDGWDKFLDPVAKVPVIESQQFSFHTGWDGQAEPVMTIPVKVK